MSLEAKIARTQQALYHYQRLMDAFGQHPEEWEWTGEIAEGNPQFDHCACGHNIRYLFPWKRKDGSPGSVITGSVCVKSVPGIDQKVIARMKVAIEKLEAQKREDERKSREILAREDVAKAEAEYQDLYTKMDDLLQRRMDQLPPREWRIPEELRRDRYLLLTRKGAHIKALKLKNPKVMAKRIRQITEAMRSDLPEGHPWRVGRG